MLRIFIGYDDRQAVSYHVLCASIIKHASRPVQISPLILPTLPIKRRGLTPFTFSRFMCPWLCSYRGKSVFLDADMMLRADITELFSYKGDFDVAVVQNAKRFEWSSVMLFDNERCQILTPQYIDNETNNPMKMNWARTIGALPAEWNHLVGYDPPNPDAKLVHFTQGVPAWPETMNCEHAGEWRSTMLEMIQARPWAEIMGNSVHAKPVLERLKTGEAA